MVAGARGEARGSAVRLLLVAPVESMSRQDHLRQGLFLDNGFLGNRAGKLVPAWPWERNTISRARWRWLPAPPARCPRSHDDISRDDGVC